MDGLNLGFRFAKMTGFPRAPVFETQVSIPKALNLKETTPRSLTSPLLKAAGIKINLQDFDLSPKFYSWM